jgi:hypothetical protein
VLVVYIAAIIAANHFLPKPKYSQKSAVAWLGRVVCAAVVLVVSPQSSVPKHELQNGIPESSQIPSGMILALVLLLLCKVFDSFSFGADIPSDEAQLEDGDSPAPARSSAIKSDQPHTAKIDRARSPQPQLRESFASPPVGGAGDTGVKGRDSSERIETDGMGSGSWGSNVDCAQRPSDSAERKAKIRKRMITAARAAARRRNRQNKRDIAVAETAAAGRRGKFEPICWRIALVEP